MTAEGLALAAAEGDDEALARLVRAYHTRVLRFGARVCRDGYDAEDAVQEAFEKLAKRPDVMVDPGALAWLMSVVKRSCLHLLKPFLREPPTLSESLEKLEDAGAIDAEGALERWEMVRAVHEAIAALDRPYREVLVLRDLEGHRGDEVARSLGLELATMKTRLHRARTKLREDLLRRDAERTKETT